MELLTKVADIFRARQEKKASGFDELVKTLAAGGKKAPSADQIAAALEEFGKAPETWRPVWMQGKSGATMPHSWQPYRDCGSSLPNCSAKGRLSAERFAPLLDAHHKKIGELNRQAAGVQIAIENAATMEDKLRETYIGPLRDEMGEIGKERAEIERAIRSIEKTAAEHENQATGQNISDEDKMSRKATAEGCRQAAAEQRKRLPPLQKREAEIMEAMLRP